MDIGDGVLATIGNTALVRLRRVVPAGCATVLVKVEGQNPTGSMKDRMALAMIGHAEQDGRLRPNDTVVEYAGGSTGASLALVCAARGYRLRLVTSDALSDDKLNQMAALGAELTVLPSNGGLITRDLTERMIDTARTLSRQPGIHWTDQLTNTDSIAGYHPLGAEIWIVDEILPVPTPDARRPTPDARQSQIRSSSSVISRCTTAGARTGSASSVAT